VLCDAFKFKIYLLPILAHMISLRIAAVESNEAGVASICSRLCVRRHDSLWSRQTMWKVEDWVVPLGVKRRVQCGTVFFYRKRGMMETSDWSWVTFSLGLTPENGHGIIFEKYFKIFEVFESN